MRHVVFLVLFLAAVTTRGAIQTVNVGAAANDGTGHSLRAAMQIINTNFLTLSNIVYGLAGTSYIDVTAAAYGADGSDTTDDTDAVTAAFAAATNGMTVYFPRGTYYVSSVSLAGSKIVRFLGASATIIHRSTATDSMFTTGTDTNTATIIFENLTLDGNKANRTARYDDNVNRASLIAANDYSKTVLVRNVTFTNSVRSAVTLAGTGEIFNSVFASMMESGTNATYTVFAQPNGTGCYLTVKDSVFRATSTSASTLYKQAGGVFVTEGSTAGNIYEKVNIDGNRFYGIGQYSASGVLLDPIRVYNGAREAVVTKNFIDGFCYGGIGIQRTDNAIIEGNTILNGSNTIDNMTFAIFYTPQAREGSSPFTGSRTNENHYVCIIRGNIIKNVKGRGIYTLGKHTLIDGNVIESVTSADDGTCQPITVNTSDVTVSNNHLRKNTKNDIWVTGSSRVKVVGNTITDDGTTKTSTAVMVIQSTDAYLAGNVVSFESESSSSGYYLSAATNVVAIGNYAKYAAAGLNVRDGSVNVTASHNQFPDCTTPVEVDTNSVAFLFDNSDLPPFTFKRNTNGTFQVYVKNKTPLGATLAGATLGVEANDSSGYIGAFPSDYSDVFRRDKMVLGTDSEASGLVVYAPFSGQTIKFYGGDTTNRVEIGTNGLVLPLIPSATLGTDSSGNVISVVGGGGSAPVGTVVNSGTPASGALPTYSGTTGTNIAPSSITVSASTNLSVPGVVTANTMVSTNTVESGAAGTAGIFTLYDTDGDHHASIGPNPVTATDVFLQFPDAPFSGLAYWSVSNSTNWTPSALTIGSGLELVGTTLNATATGSGGNWNASGDTNSTLAGIAAVHALIATNAVAVGPSNTVPVIFQMLDSDDSHAFAIVAPPTVDTNNAIVGTTKAYAAGTIFKVGAVGTATNAAGTSYATMTLTNAVSNTDYLPATSPSIATSATITGAANTTALTVTGGSVTGSGTTPFETHTGTWNTSGNAIGKRNIITNTASGASSKLETWETDSGEKLSIDKSGYLNGATDSDLFSGQTVRASNYLKVAGGILSLGSDANAFALFDMGGQLKTVFGSGVSLGFSSSSAAAPTTLRANLDAFFMRDTAATIQMGLDAATATNQKFKAHDGSGTDKDGADLTLSGGQSTGTGRGGLVSLETTPSGSTGSSANSYTKRGAWIPKAVTLTESTATTVATIAVPSGKFVGGSATITVYASDGTEHQCRTLAFPFSAVNKAGTVTGDKGTPVEAVIITGGGTLTATITLVANGNAVDIKVDATSSLTQTTLSATVALPAINSNDTAAVTEI